MVDSPPLATSDAGWLAPPRGAEPAAVRLICWPYAGLGPALFAPWVRSAPAGLAVYGVQAPGRQRRLGEVPISSLPGLLDGAVAALETAPGALAARPYALLGCSFGAIASFELARRLVARGHPPPVSVFALACRPPHAVHPLTAFSTLDDRALLDRLDRDYGGVPDILKDNPEIVELLVPALRADLTALERYVLPAGPSGAPAPLPCPLHAIGGDADATVSPAVLREWLAYGAAGSRATLLPGGHFFVRDDPPAAFAPVVAALAPWLPGAA